MYRICVCGQLNPEWSQRLQGMEITIKKDYPLHILTELSGVLPDQAALMGVLQHLYACNVPLLSVECIGTGLPDDGLQPRAKGN